VTAPRPHRRKQLGQAEDLGEELRADRLPGPLEVGHLAVQHLDPPDRIWLADRQVGQDRRDPVADRPALVRRAQRDRHERAHDQPVRQLPASVPQVVAEVEVLVVRPERADDLPRQRPHNLPVPGHKRQLRGVEREQVRMRRSRAVEHGQRADVRRDVLVLDEVELRVQRVHPRHGCAPRRPQRDSTRPHHCLRVGSGTWRRRGRSSQ